MSNAVYDVLIVGAGPAGMTAAIYARRAGKSVLIVEKETFGGQITHSPKVENYPGYKEMSGLEFADKLTEQVLSLGAEIELDTVLSVERAGELLVAHGECGTYNGKTLIVASGSHHRTLGIDGEEELVGHGISYCAICDGAFYAGREVAVIGGGNTALQEAVMLSEYCKKVTVVQNLAFLTGEESLVKQLEKKENVAFLLSRTVAGFVDKEGELTALRLAKENGEIEMLTVDGIFVAIGQVPENGPFSSLCALDERGYIASGEDCVTADPAVFVAGDCRTKRIRQITTATGDGAVAALSACRYLDDHKA